MPPFDRDSALKKADKALRQGRIEAAIEEYVRVVEAQPRDWNSANALGDLYVRAGQIDRGVAQYARIADHLAKEGFYPKSSALYKKILKVKPTDEYALLQSGEIAAKQGLLADARQAFSQVAERRRSRNDSKGAAEMGIRIGTLDPDDLDARLSAARAASDIGDNVTAFREFREVGVRLERLERRSGALAALQSAFEIEPGNVDVRGRLVSGYVESGDFGRARAVASGATELKKIAVALEATGHTVDALEVLVEVAALDPRDLDVRARLARAYVEMGDFARARTFLTEETAAQHPELWLTLAEIELSGNRLDKGRAAVVRALTLGAHQRAAALELAERLVTVSPEAAYQCIDALVEEALAENDYPRAAAAIGRLTARLPTHIMALMRLVEVALDGKLESTMYDAQAQLAAAYLHAGRGLEARIISEDLVARELSNVADVERFRKALVLLGEGDPEAIIADRLNSESPFCATEQIDFNEGIDLSISPSPAPSVSGLSDPTAWLDEGQRDSTLAEIDLTEQLFGDTPPAPSHTAGSLDDVFQGLRDQMDRTPGEEGAAEQYRLALRYREMGLLEETITALEGAARSPGQRFDAASMLGRLHLEGGRPAKAVKWFERAAEAPAPTPDAGRALRYDLAHTLEAEGEHGRALAVFLALDSEMAGYRDVGGRIERLSKAQDRG